MDETMENIIEIASKAMVEYDVAHGKKYNDFINRQPDIVKDVLQKINEQTMKERELVDSHDAIMIKVRAELAKLKPFNEKVKAERKVANSIYEKANKSAQNLNEQTAKLEQIRLKSGETSPDFQKQQGKVAVAQKVKDNDELAKIKKAEEMENVDRAYKKAFIESILLALSMLAETRVDECGQRSQIGDEIEKLSDDIVQPTDTSIETLEKELQELDNLSSQAE